MEMIIGAMVMALVVTRLPAAFSDAYQARKAAKAGAWDWLEAQEKRRDARSQRRAEWALRLLNGRKERKTASDRRAAPRRPGMRMWMADVWHGAWEDALERRTAKRAAREPFDPFKPTLRQRVTEAMRRKVAQRRALGQGIPPQAFGGAPATLTPGQPRRYRHGGVDWVDDGDDTDDDAPADDAQSVWNNCVPVDGPAGVEKCPNCGSYLSLPAVGCSTCGVALRICRGRKHVLVRRGVVEDWSSCPCDKDDNDINGPDDMPPGPSSVVHTDDHTYCTGCEQRQPPKWGWRCNKCGKGREGFASLAASDADAGADPDHPGHQCKAGNQPAEGGVTVGNIGEEVLGNEAARRAFRAMGEGAAKLAEAARMAEEARRQIAAAAEAAGDGMASVRFDAGATAAVADINDVVGTSTLTSWEETADQITGAAKDGLTALEKYRDAEDVVESNRVDARTLEPSQS